MLHYYYNIIIFFVFLRFFYLHHRTITQQRRNYLRFLAGMNVHPSIIIFPVVCGRNSVQVIFIVIFMSKRPSKSKVSGNVFLSMEAIFSYIK